MPSHQERREPLPKGYQFGEQIAQTFDPRGRVFETAHRIAHGFKFDREYDEADIRLELMKMIRMT